MEIKTLKFKLTTYKKWRCHKCKKQVFGKEGFIHIKQLVDSGFWGGSAHTRICWDCFVNLIKECEHDRENREEKWKEMTKKAILRKL